MMKTHILMSGHARTFAHCWPNIRWFLIRHFSEPVFYIHADPEGAEQFDRLNKEGYEVHHKYAPQPKEWPNIGDAAKHAPYRISVPESAIWGQLWHLRQAFKLLEDDAIGFERGDVFIRLRPDTWFLRDVTDAELRDNTVTSAAWGRFGGMNDRFAITRYFDLFDDYCTTYDKIPGLLEDGCPFHPESLTFNSVGIGFHHFSHNIQFGNLRPNGELRFPEQLPWDVV